MRNLLFCAAALLTLTLTACGPNKVLKSSDLASRGGDSPIPVTSRMAECNRIDIQSPRIAGQVSTYYEASQLIPTYIRMNLVAIPSQIYSSSTHYIQLYRWFERNAGQPVVNPTPVTMYFIQKSTGMVSNSQGSTRISKGEIESIINSAKLSILGVTAANFFERHFVILTGMDLSYDAVKFAYYDSSQGSNAIGSGDVLLPAFYANPNTYVAANPIPSLYMLHPNYNYRTSGATEEIYFGMTEEICAGFFGRVPASIDLPKPGFFTNLWQSVRSFLHNLFGL